MVTFQTERKCGEKSFISLSCIQNLSSNIQVKNNFFFWEETEITASNFMKFYKKWYILRCHGIPMFLCLCIDMLLKCLKYVSNVKKNGKKNDFLKQKKKNYVRNMILMDEMEFILTDFFKKNKILI